MNDSANLVLINRLLSECVNEQRHYESYLQFAGSMVTQAVSADERFYWLGEAQRADELRNDWLVYAEALKDLIQKHKELQGSFKLLGDIAAMQQPPKPKKVTVVEMADGHKVGRCSKCEKTFSFSMYGRNCPYCTPQGVN